MLAFSVKARNIEAMLTGRSERRFASMAPMFDVSV
jgi:hypothetical protein